MQIQTQDNQQSTELPIFTIGIAQDLKQPNRIYMLHCLQCGKSQVKIQGKITRIVPWLEPTSETIVIDSCKRCSFTFTLQTTRPREKVLVRLPEYWSYPFMCLICSKDIPMSSTFPHEQRCIRCTVIYDFREMV